MEDNLIYKGAAIFVILLTVILLAKDIVNDEKMNLNQRTVNYTCYYNGQEVDRNKVDIFQYDYSIDDNNQKIFLTDKSKDSSHVVMMPGLVRVG